MTELRAKWSVIGTILYLEKPGLLREVVRLEIPEASMAEVALGAMRWVYHNGTDEQREALQEACESINEGKRA